MSRRFVTREEIEQLVTHEPVPIRNWANMHRLARVIDVFHNFNVQRMVNEELIDEIQQHAEADPRLNYLHHMNDMIRENMSVTLSVFRTEVLEASMAMNDDHWVELFPIPGTPEPEPDIEGPIQEERYEQLTGRRRRRDEVPEVEIIDLTADIEEEPLPQPEYDSDATEVLDYNQAPPPLPRRTRRRM